ncbi:MAG: hypothetical protein NC253_06020 [Ruminococcus sp.]|nr:hypothetical protein [Ruminococcus sp.]MCM1382577.1 hypothetical protein [Muribaculaceae bacterium]MCM1480211.1 hypothetical protein [Muribaculaceae bacterium]
MNGNYERPNIPLRRNMNSSMSGGMSSQNNSNMQTTTPADNGMNGTNSTNSTNNANNSNNSSGANSPAAVNSDNLSWLEQQIKEHPEFRTPPQQSFDAEEMEGSIQKILAENIGNYVVVEFLIGTERINRKQGFLYHVGTSYITLYDDENENFILCDIFSVKFVYFYTPGQRPNRNFNILPHSNGNSG